MSLHLKRPIFASITLLIIFSMAIASLGAFYSPVQSQDAHSNPQSTDIFTGQFIPAYLGSAYDPTEAYKQLAGATVYVFAYDTWGQPVNTFAYRTQVRADGSFQAAGLSNASHYAVYFPDPGLGSPNSNKYFRSPKDSDNLQSVFAYQQATYPIGNNCHAPGLQIKGQALNGSNGNADICAAYDVDKDGNNIGQPLFVTSSRTVDIANHVNIFPLIPTSALSVIITDDQAGVTALGDSYNYNKPYEIYAQRIVVNNPSSTPDQSALEAYQAQQEAYQSCLSAATANQSGPTSKPPSSCSPPKPLDNAPQNLLTTGPVIRGRTIDYSPTLGNGDPAGQGTIFQAFAPRGLYAITYWRPNSSNPSTAITYLNYDGVTSLGTPINGEAFEQVTPESSSYTYVAKDSQGHFTSLPIDWGYLSSRPIKDGSKDFHTAWHSKPGSLNSWGLITTPINGVAHSFAGARVVAESPALSFVDIANRTCSADAFTTPSGATYIPNVTTTGTFGVYFFTTACNTGSNINLSSTNTTISVFGSSYQPQTGIHIVASGQEGPSSYTVGMVSTILNNGIAGQAMDQQGQPLPLASIDLKANGLLFPNVAQTDSNGRFMIGGGYFVGFNPSSSYTIVVHSSGSRILTGQDRTVSFRLNTQSLRDPQMALNNIGSFSAYPNTSAVGRWLANLTLPLLVNIFHMPTAYAQGATGSAGSNPQGGFSSDELDFYFDQKTLAGLGTDFTPANYNLDQVEIDAPDDATTIMPDVSNPSNYVVFNRYGDSSDGSSLSSLITVNMTKDKKGVPYTALSGESATQDSQIIGVRLKLKKYNDEKGSSDPIKYTFYDIMRLYYTQQGGKSSADFNFRVRFDKSDAQKSNTSIPDSIAAEFPLTFSLNTSNPIPTTTDGWGNESNYLVSYAQIPMGQVPPNCGGGDGGNFTLNPFHDVAVVSRDAWGVISKVTDPTKAFGELMCDVVVGTIHGVERIVGWMADKIFVVDPLGTYSITADIWNIMRNFVNSLAVFLLVASGVAIMLRYEPKTFSLQSVLTRLIVTVILVNFSILIIQAAIDIANVLSLGGYHFIVSAISDISDKQSYSTSGLAGAAAGLGALGVYLFILISATTSGVGAIGLLIVLLGIFVLLGYVVLRAFVDYGFRLVVLILCISLAPLAFAANVLPGTQKFYARWKGILIGALIAQVTAAAIFGLAMGVIANVARGNGGIFQGALSMFIAIGLFYYSTKAPAKVASMYGENLAGGLEAGLRKGATELRATAIKARINNRTKAMKNKALEENLQIGDRNWLYRKGRLAAIGLRQKSLLGSAEELEKAKHEGEHQADETYKSYLQRTNAHAYERVEEQERLKTRLGIDSANASVLQKAMDDSDAALRAGIVQEAQDDTNKTRVAVRQAIEQYGNTPAERAENELALAAKRRREVEDAAANKRSEMVDLALKRRNDYLQDRERQAKFADQVADSEGKIAAQRELYDTTASGTAREKLGALANDRAIRVERARNAAEDTIANAIGMEEFPSILTGERTEAVDKRELTLGDRSADAIIGTTYSDAKDFANTGTALAAEYGWLDDNGNILQSMGDVSVDASGNGNAGGAAKLWNRGWVKYQADIRTNIGPDAARQANADRAFGALNSQIDGTRLNDTKSLKNFVENEMDYTDGAGNHRTGLQATTAILQDLGIKTEGMKPPQVSNLAQKMLTERVLAKAGTVDSAILSDDEKAVASAWIKDNSRSLSQLGSSGISDKVYVKQTDAVLQPGEYGITLPPPIGPFANPFADNNPILGSGPSHPIKMKDLEKVQQALVVVGDAWTKANAGHLGGGAGNALTGDTEPTKVQYSAAIQTLRQSGYQIR